MIFAAGLLAGGGIAVAAFGLAKAPQAQVASGQAISKVSGWDGTVAPAAAQVARAVPTSPSSSPSKTRAAAPAPIPAPAPPVASAERRSAAQIANDALGFTVFVHGGRVYGAGVLLDRKGHVLTCQHVIAGLDQIEVSFSDGSAFPATVIESDPKLDLALLQIADDRVAKIEPASVTGVQLGDDVYAIGAPRKMAFSLSRGMISFIGRPFEGVYYLQTDLAMNGGSSGGPVLNDRGQVIALSSFVLRDSEGLAFALPIEYAYRRFGAHLQTPKSLVGSARSAFEGWLSTLDSTSAQATVSARR